MNKKVLLTGGALAALSIGLIALPGSSATRFSEQQNETAKLEERLQKLQARLDSLRVASEAHQATTRVLERLQDIERLPEVQAFDLLGDEGASWLGVEVQEVSSDFAKEHKLSAERGVVLGKVIADSPAAKAGLKENDVITEINGQRVEGTAQFRRMIREIPAGRSVQLGVVRDGHSQSISATLGKSEQGRRVFTAPAAPGTYSFRIPDMPEVMEL